jgi:hypothetical protein
MAARLKAFRAVCVWVYGVSEGRAYNITEARTIKEGVEQPVACAV